MLYNSANNNLQLIVSLCQSLTKSGVTPTVALIKKHANTPLPLPEIISVLRNWKLDPNQYPNTDAELTNAVEPDLKTPEKIIRTLETRVDKLEQQMATLLKSLE